ncbi:MAG: DUF6524 family protein [Pseudomonadota bacterium]
MIGFLLRWLFAFVLLAATFNPTPYNYITFARDAYQTQLSLVVLGGLVLLIGYIIYLRATLRSIGVFGVLLVAGLLGALAWVAVDLEILTLDNPSVNLWLANISMSFVLGVGLSWSIIRRKLSGQADVDDVDE